MSDTRSAPTGATAAPPIAPGSPGAKVATLVNNTVSSGKQRLRDALKKMWNSFRWVLLVVAVFTVLALASVWNMKRAKTYTKSELSRIQSLLQYAAKSAEEAERAEKTDPLQALLHANYALCYLNASKHIVDAKTIESLLGSNVDEMDRYLKDLQHRQLQRVYAAS